MASALLGFGLVSVAGVTAAAARSLGTAWALEDGAAAVQALVDSLSAATGGGDGQRQAGPGRIIWSVEAGPAAPGWVRYEHPALSRPIEVAFLTASSW